jgi:hypothetical protein
MNKKNMYSIIAVIVCASSFILSIGLGVLYFKNRKLKDEIQERLVSIQNN